MGRKNEEGEGLTPAPVGATVAVAVVVVIVVGDDVIVTSFTN